jgi:hypothetical protein
MRLTTDIIHAASSGAVYLTCEHTAMAEVQSLPQLDSHAPGRAQKNENLRTRREKAFVKTRLGPPLISVQPIDEGSSPSPDLMM